MRPPSHAGRDGVGVAGDRDVVCGVMRQRAQFVGHALFGTRARRGRDVDRERMPLLASRAGVGRIDQRTHLADALGRRSGDENGAVGDFAGQLQRPRADGTDEQRRRRRGWPA